MPTKDEIIDNIGDYSIPQLVEFIHQGIISREDLNNVPQFAHQRRVELDAALSRLSAAEETSSVDDEAEWQKAKERDTIDAYNTYLKNTNNGKYADDARKRIAELSNHPDTPAPSPSNRKRYGKSDLEKLIDKLSNRPSPSDNEAVKLINTYASKNGVEAIIDEMKKNPNLISAGTVKTLYEGNVFTSDQLESIFPVEFLDAMYNGEVAPQPNVQPTQLDNISSPSTEVYFWGISQSGKSCMLAALLSVARRGIGDLGGWQPLKCSGWGYMDILSKLMSPERVTPVAPGTPIGTTYDMSFQFTTRAQKKKIVGKDIEKSFDHPITFIDLAGGMLDLMYYFETAPNSLSDTDKQKLSNLTQIIRANCGTNRKIHFFVVEYGAEGFKAQGRTDQDALLTTAAKYIKDENIFHKDTDAIYFVITKVDKTGKHGEEAIKELERYTEENYKSFYGMLKDICNENEIKTFKLLPFKIGEVMMQSYCKLDPTPSKNILEEIVNRTFSTDKSILGNAKKVLRG